MMSKTKTEKLKRFSERLVAIAEEKAACANDEREVLKEASDAGFDKKAMKRLAGYMVKNAEGRLTADRERDVFDEYRVALGVLPLERVELEAKETANGKDKDAPAPAPA